MASKTIRCCCLIALLLCNLVFTIQAGAADKTGKSGQKPQESPFINFGAEDEIQETDKRIQKMIAEGKMREALPLAQKAVDLAAATFGEDHVSYAQALNNLGWAQQSSGDYKAARTSFEKALKIYETTYGADSALATFTLNNLAILLCFQGDYDSALPLMERVLSGQTMALGVNNPGLIDTLNNIAAVQSNLGKHDACIETLQHALSLKDVTEDARSQTLNNLAVVSQHKGDYKSAKNFLEQVIEKRRAAATDRQPDMIEILNNLANINFWLGNPAQAKKLLNQALDIARETVGENHVDYATTLSNLALIDYQSGDKSIARYAFLRVAQNLNQQIDNVLPSMSFAEQRAFLSKRIPNSISYLLTSARESADIEAIYNHVFRWKGLLIEALRWQSFLSRVSGQSSSESVKELISVRAELAGLFNKTTMLEIDAWQKRFNELSKRKSELERTVLTQGEFGGLSDILSSISLKDFLKLLHDDELLVDLYVYNDVSERNDKRYGAFVCDNTGNVSYVDMGPASLFDVQIDQWRKATLGNKPSDVDMQVLRHSLLEKLALDKRSQTKLFISTDGEFTRFPINIFWSEQASKVEVAQLDSPRELAYLRSGRHGPDTKAGNMLIVGGVDFGKGGGLFEFPKLPGTIAEAKAVIDIAQSNAITCQYISGRDASKQNVVDNLKRSDLAHLATHGIFSDAGFAVEQIRLRINTNGLDPGKEAARNPLLSSSLVLAPAADSKDDQPDLLTAEELIGTDLRKCKMLVMSACETGLGTKETGQGILGLRAAMMAAGARTLVMSLWKVPDIPTMVLMQTFYDNMLNEHQPPSLALRNAQERVRTMMDGKFAKPINWGAWVLVGEGWK